MRKDCLPKIFLHKICVEMNSFQSDYTVALWNPPTELAHYLREKTDRQPTAFNKNPLGKYVSMH